MGTALFHPECRYESVLVGRPRVGADGILVGAQEVDWARVRRVFCADVGEPQGIRTIVFDLAFEQDHDLCRAYRLDAEPGEAACEMGRALERVLGSERTGAGLREVAKDGSSSRWFPDLESFEDANLESIRRERR